MFFQPVFTLKSHAGRFLSSDAVVWYDFTKVLGSSAAGFLFLIVLGLDVDNCDLIALARACVAFVPTIAGRNFFAGNFALGASMEGVDVRFLDPDMRG